MGGADRAGMLLSIVRAYKTNKIAGGKVGGEVLYIALALRCALGQAVKGPQEGPQGRDGRRGACI